MRPRESDDETLFMRIRFLLTLLTALFSGCTTSASTTPTIAPTFTPSPTLTPDVTAITATPTLQAIDTTQRRLLIWMPEPLNPVGDDATSVMFERQLSEFEAANSNIEVEWRLKRVEEVGGIMATLRTASAVAPGALPDLTLVRREDLLEAVQLGLIQPLEGRASSAILGDLYPAALRLGQVDGQLYGLPYMLETQHLVYRPPLSLAGWSFGAVLARDVPFVFPAGRANGVNDVFLIQYLAALPDDEAAQVLNGELPVNEDALHTVFSFYEQAIEKSIVTPSVLDFSTPIDYAAYLGEGTVLVNSTTYLTVSALGEDLQFAPIPTASGGDVTMLDGWMWVMTTTNAERQTMALQFISWMMDAQRHGDYSTTVHMVPSQRSTLRRWDDANYADFIDEMLNNAYLPLSETTATSARVMQNALGSVLLGQSTADEATQDVLAQLSG
jgi:ABC-type glycerol-3-phosphate transport system substrate-binding protein